ncbi:MAG: hypothetical protein Hals2KO_24950 [Halioglobus sp.]
MLKKLQAFTGLLFAVFLAIHLVNTWLASFGASTYDSAQSVLRTFYQAPAIEFVILLALVVHIITGLVRRWREGAGPSALRARLHRYAGYGLALVIGGHILAVRGPSWFFDVYPGFAGISFTMDFAAWYFFPYYLLLGTAAFYHGLNGAGIALSRLGLGSPASGNTLRNASILAAVATAAALLAFAGVWTETGDPYASEFAQLYLKVMDEISF